MILKTHNFTLPKLFLFNAAGAVLGLATVAYIVRDALLSDSVAPCGPRYQQAMAFALQSDGAPIGPADLQARLAGRDWGVMENVSVARATNGPSPFVLHVNLRRAPVAQPGDGSPSSGMGFQWMPRQLAGARSACLSYSLHLPSNFEFAPGGALPGFFGGPEPGPAATGGGFSVRARWRGDGRLDIRAALSGAPEILVLPVDQPRLVLARGRWTRIDQEVVLNSPGAADGIIRVWIDDVLKLERTGLAIRGRQDGLAGLVADVHYSRGDLTWVPSPRDTSLQLSPFEIRWN